jgi:UDP-N-acetylmuramate--alanine ligase
MNTDQDLARKRIKRIHFIGIGGAGMSGIAEVIANLGYEVSGSDIASNAVTQRLQDMGCTVYKGHNKRNISEISFPTITVC